MMSAETLSFKTELKQLLHLIIHSLYSHKDIVLRELISNASDAINKLKFDSLSREDLLENDKDWKIKISTDAAAGTLTVNCYLRSQTRLLLQDQSRSPGTRGIQGDGRHGVARSGDGDLAGGGEGGAAEVGDRPPALGPP